MLKELPVDTYMDDRLLAADHTLLRYTAIDTASAKVPARAGALYLTEAGSGAIIVRNIPRLQLEEGYTLLKDGCLVADKNLKELELPSSLIRAERSFYRSGGLERIILHRLLDAESFSMMMENAIPLYDGSRLIAPSDMKSSGLSVIYDVSMFSGPPLTVLLPDMRILFTDDGNASLFDERPCYDLSARFSVTEEYTEIMAMIRDGVTGWRHSVAEKKSDLRIRSNSAFSRPIQLSLAILMPVTGHSAGGSVEATLILTKARLFTPQLLPVRLDGVQYYLYSRNHLTSDRSCLYYREDVCIFDETGLVTDKKLSEAVYGKARLLILL